MKLEFRFSFRDDPRVFRGNLRRCRNYWFLGTEILSHAVRMSPGPSLSLVTARRWIPYFITMVGICLRRHSFSNDRSCNLVLPITWPTCNLLWPCPNLRPCGVWTLEPATGSVQNCALFWTLPPRRCRRHLDFLDVLDGKTESRRAIGTIGRKRAIVAMTEQWHTALWRRMRSIWKTRSCQKASCWTWSLLRFNFCCCLFPYFHLCNTSCFR